MAKKEATNPDVSDLKTAIAEKRFGSFITDTKEELTKVVWPPRQQLISESVAVILMVTLVSTVIYLVDNFFSWIAKQPFLFGWSLLHSGALQNINMSFADDQFPVSLDDPQEKPKKTARWYAVQVASGCEKRVKATLEQRIHTMDVATRILQVEIPKNPTIKIRKDGSRLQGEEKIFPGYVLVRMIMDDDVWQVVKNTPHVINFVGSEQKRHYGRGRGHVEPLPLSQGEVDRIFKQAEEQEPILKIEMRVGDKIMVLSGPFKDFEGEVIEVSQERSKLKALLSIFGRDTPVELEFNQVEKQN